jgi:translation initiation factor 2B subunit (eIF-2B alpha/beta/delta family)
VVHNFNAPVGAVQTGPGSTAHVQQQWINGETSELLAALLLLRQALERAPDVEPEARRELIVEVDSATTELQKEHPNESRLLRWLGGIGAVVGSIGSVQPAYEAVKALARALGLSI